MSDEEEEEEENVGGHVDDGAPPPMAVLRPLLARLAKDWLTFEHLRQVMLNQGAPDPLLVNPTDRDVEQAVLALLDPTRPSEQVERAYMALTRSLASHPDIAKSWFVEAPQADGTQDAAALQAMLEARNDVFARWNQFQEGMYRVGLTVCQVRVDDQFKGTGFLVGDRHVLTACHCVAALIKCGRQVPESHKLLHVVFDDIVMPGKTRSVYRTKVMAARDWLISHSLPDDGEDTAPMPLQDICDGRLDFALIRLAEPAGVMAPKYQSSMPRKWIELKELATEPKAQAQILIAHHPGGADLRLSVGLFRDHANASRRVRYLAPAIVGSSGAPCFSIEWKPYALHNAGYAKVPVNQGVPLTLIWDAIGGPAAFTNADASQLLMPAVTPDGEPILGRTDIAREVDAILRGESTTTVMTIAGRPESGKEFTAMLMRSMLIDRGHSAFAIYAEKFAADTPESFASRMIHEIKGGVADTPQPPSPDSRQRARWISRSLSDWTRSRVVAQAQPESESPQAQEQMIWVILNRCDVVRFTPETHDLLVALIGDDPAADEHPLRFVLMGYSEDLAAVSPERVWQTTLELISVNGVLPFMEHVLGLLSMAEDPETLRKSATSFVETATNFGVNTIPKLVMGLERWRKTRQAAVNAAAAGPQGAAA